MCYVHYHETRKLHRCGHEACEMCLLGWWNSDQRMAHYCAYCRKHMLKQELDQVAYGSEEEGGDEDGDDVGNGDVPADILGSWGSDNEFEDDVEAEFLDELEDEFGEDSEEE